MGNVDNPLMAGGQNTTDYQGEADSPTQCLVSVKSVVKGVPKSSFWIHVTERGLHQTVKCI